MVGRGRKFKLYSQVIMKKKEKCPGHSQWGRDARCSVCFERSRDLG